MKDNTLRDRIKDIVCSVNANHTLADYESPTNELEALLAEEVRKARLDEIAKADHYMLKQLVQYDKRMAYYDDRIAELEKEGKL